MGNHFSQVQWKFLFLSWMLSQPPSDAWGCVYFYKCWFARTPSDFVLDLRVFISINALWLISFLLMIFITFSICTKDASFKLLTYISDQNIYIYIYIYICMYICIYNWKDWCWSWNSNILATWCKELTHWKRPWCWERLKAGGEGDDRGQDGWMASSTQ